MERKKSLQLFLSFDILNPKFQRIEISGTGGDKYLLSGERLV